MGALFPEGNRKKIGFYCMMLVCILLIAYLLICCVHAKDARALCAALENGDITQLERLLEEGVYVNGTTHTILYFPVAVIMDSDFPTTPLLEACEQGNCEAVRMLLEYGADPNKRVLGGFSCIGAVYSIPKGRNARFEIVPLLVSYGASVEGTGHGIATNHAAFLEAERATDENAEQSIALIDTVTDDPIGLKNGYGATLLGVVDSVEVAKWLIESGADVNAADREGDTPLMYAASSGNAEIVALLLQSGAQPDTINKSGTTAYDRALNGSYEQIAEMLRTAN